ncbi:hypothetical protein SRHO_G00004960 [Serrasalmus rhombeus]
MFLARVLVGEFTVGHPHFCRPPSKDLSIANFFDSCVDDMINPKIFVIFDSNQIYPDAKVTVCSADMALVMACLRCKQHNRATDWKRIDGLVCPIGSGCQGDAHYAST